MVLICDCDAPYAHDWVTLPVVVIDRCMVGRQLDCGKHLCNDGSTFRCSSPKHNCHMHRCCCYCCMGYCWTRYQLTDNTMSRTLTILHVSCARSHTSASAVKEGNLCTCVQQMLCELRSCVQQDQACGGQLMTRSV